MKWWVVAIVVGVLVVRVSCREDLDRVRIATFNIEHFPKNARQVERAFDEIAGTGATIIAAQEITAPAVFLEAAPKRLRATRRPCADGSTL